MKRGKTALFFSRSGYLLAAAVVCLTAATLLPNPDRQAEVLSPIELSFNNRTERSKETGENTKLSKKLYAGGYTAGIKLFADGVMVVGLSSIKTAQGTKIPASEAGIKTGDMISSVEGIKVLSLEELSKEVNNCGGKTVSLEIVRGGKDITIEVNPALDPADGIYKIGTWVRDSMAGIGTVTFYDPDSGVYGALGHGICDVDTGELMPVAAGGLMRSSVVGALKGLPGVPGELKGEFDLETDIGGLDHNSPYGIFGIMYDKDVFKGRSVNVMPATQVKTGKATIMANITGDKVEEFEIEIIRIYDTPENQRDMMIRITDERLKKVTGGIVQGMSGSPIIQDGKLAGAVTHVLVNDPQRGYGIFIERMLSEASDMLKDKKIA